MLLLLLPPPSLLALLSMCRTGTFRLSRSLNFLKLFAQARAQLGERLVTSCCCCSLLLLLPLPLPAGTLRLPKSLNSLKIFAQEGLVREGTLPITSSAYLTSRLIYPFMIVALLQNVAEALIDKNSNHTIMLG
jgi:hypothetical protein